MIFFTWNHQEFKDKFNELVITEEKVENIYENKNIISKDKYKILMYGGIVLAGIIALIGVVKLFNFIFNNRVDVTGMYTYYSDSIILRKDGTCNIDDIIYDEVNECSWRFNENSNTVVINYEYEDYSYRYGYTTEEDTLYLEYDPEENILEYETDEYERQEKIELDVRFF